MGALPTDIAAIANKINKEYGDGTLVLGSQITHELIPRITTGSVSLDVALGGGWAANQWNELIGLESHGKTATVLKTVAANQALDPNWFCYWVAAEEFVPSYAAMCGCDLDRISVLNSNMMEVAFQSVIEALEKRAVDCVVIDSLPLLLPNLEDEKMVGESSMGRGAMLINQFFRKQEKAIKRSLLEHERPVTCFMINQWRDKIGVLWGDPRTTPGGKGKNFSFFTRVEVARDDWIQDDAKVKVGITIKQRVMKNKTGPPERRGAVDFYFSDDLPFRAGYYDNPKEVVGLAVGSDVIDRGGSTYRYGGRSWRGRDTLVASVREEVELYSQLLADVRLKLLPNRTVKSNGKKPVRRRRG